MQHQFSTTIYRAVASTLLALLAGCSSSQAPTAASSKAGTTVASAPAATACGMLDAAQMSSIMGETLTTEPHDEKLATIRYTECRYFGASHDHFRIMVSIQRSNVTAYVKGLKIPPHGAVTANNPYADLGDGAKSFGAMMYILDGSDLIGIASRVAFVDNPDMAQRHRVAEEILKALKPKLAATRN